MYRNLFWEARKAPGTYLHRDYLYLHKNISLEDLKNFKNYPEMIGIKYYPKSATTNSEDGIENIESIFDFNLWR